MKIIWILFFGLFQIGCQTTSHPIIQSDLGVATNSQEMESVLDIPTDINLTTVASVNWTVPLSGLINLDNPKAQAAKLKDKGEPIKIFVHILSHPKFGNFLIDTGVSKKLIENSSDIGVSYILRKGMHVEKMQLIEDTASIIKKLNSPIKGVFFTHLHLDHISGLPDLDKSIPLYIGKTESNTKHFINFFVQSTTNNFLEGRLPLHEWIFRLDDSHRFEGVIDIFGDKSVFAISVPGHTSGSVAYLVRSKTGPVLITGDTCHTLWGWENVVEPGDFTRFHEKNLENLTRLKKLVIEHPSISVRLGHQ